MAERTAIQWCDHTFNPWWGCAKVSPGCDHCYAETHARRFGPGLWGPKAGRRFFGERHWAEPLRWARRAKRDGVRRRVFCGSMCDVFEPRVDLVGARSRLFDLIAETPELDWLLLTKRPGAIQGALPWGRMRSPWPNVWLGTTVENQELLARRVAKLEAVPAVVRFLSLEPLLGPIDLEGKLAGIDWVIVGGESGRKARPCSYGWIRSIVHQCQAAGVAVFVKQLGARYVDEINGVGGRQAKAPPEYGRLTRRLAHHKGGDPAEWPECLRVREVPS